MYPHYLSLIHIFLKVFQAYLDDDPLYEVVQTSHGYTSVSYTHLPLGHNPHCHIMLTMRAIDENGKWMPKSRKVYDLDENGERIKLPSGRWKRDVYKRQPLLFVHYSNISIQKMYGRKNP